MLKSCRAYCTLYVRLFFEKHGRIEIGLYFLNCSGLSFLYNGITFAILSLSETISVCNDLLNTCASWFAIWGIIFCTTYGSILSTPLDLLEFPDFTIFIISVGSVGAHKKLAVLRFLCWIGSCPVFGSFELRLLPMFVKYLLTCSTISFCV